LISQKRQRIASFAFHFGGSTMAQKFILLACVFLIGGNCLAQDLIQTDRPDHTEGVFIIKKNTIQLESGFYHEVLKNKSSLMFVPTSLIKFGVSKNFELQTQVDFTALDGRGALSPITLGFKANLWKERGLRPEFAIIGRVQLKNLGAKEVQLTKNLPLLRLAFQNNLSPYFVLGYNLGIHWQEFERPSYIISSSLNYHLSKRATLYAELFNETSEATFLNPIADVGGMFLLGQEIILDASIGKQLNSSSASSFYYTLGFTTRLHYKK
jgi:hypothetical protein